MYVFAYVYMHYMYMYIHMHVHVHVAKELYCAGSLGVPSNYHYVHGCTL